MGTVSSFAWFPYSLGSIILFGISLAFYKRPSTNGENPRAVNFWQTAVGLVVTVLLFHSYLGSASGTALLWSAVWGVGFAILSLLQIYALHHVDTNSLFPITSTSALVVSVSSAILLFGDKISLVQGLGIFLTILTVYLFLYKGGHLLYSRQVLWIGAAIIFFSALNKITQKLAVDRVDIHLFQIYSSLFAFLFMAALLLYFEREKFSQVVRTGFKSGLFIGVPGILGGYLILVALSKGPFALITSLHSFYTIITALVAWMFFGEQLTKRKVFLIGLAIVAVLLIRLG